MRILVTGAKGQIGSELISHGQEMGFQMIAASHSKLDITIAEAVNRYISSQNPDIVINGASYTAVDKAEDEYELAYAINGDGPAHLAKACAKSEIPLLHISTDYIFDGTNKDPYHEDDCPNPMGVYGKSKLAGEIAVKSILKQHFILRVAWVFGATGNNFVHTMLSMGRERDELKVVADQYGCPTWSEDIARVLLTIAERYQKREIIPWGTYHYAGEPVTTWFNFAQAIFAETSILGMLEKSPRVKAISTEEYPTKLKRPKNTALNCQKIQGLIAIPQPDWHIGLSNVLLNWKNQ